MGQSRPGKGASHGPQEGEVLGTTCVAKGLPRQVGAAQSGREQIIEGKKHKGLTRGASRADPRAGLQRREEAGSWSPPLHGEEAQTRPAAKPSTATDVLPLLEGSLDPGTNFVFSIWLLKKDVLHTVTKFTTLCFSEILRKLLIQC